MKQPAPLISVLPASWKHIRSRGLSSGRMTLRHLAQKFHCVTQVKCYEEGMKQRLMSKGVSL